MKKLFFLLTVLFVNCLAVTAQSPGFFNYQGVVRNSVGNALVNKTIRLRLTIHDGSTTGIPVYRETRVLTTNAFGLFNVQVGGGGATDVLGAVSAIDWKSGTKWMQVEVDTEGTGTFKDIGSTQLSSVPYALFTNLTADIILPFVKTQSEELPLLKITNTGNNASSLAMEGISNSTANNAAAVRGIIASPSPGIFSAGVIGQNNGTTGNGVGVYGSQNGTGYGIYGTAPGGVGVYGNSVSGTGVYGQSVNGPSVMGYQPNTGTANAGYFQNFNANNNSAAVRVLTNGTGEGLAVNTTGSGKGAVINIINAANGSNVLEVSTNGMGRAALFQNSNAANTNNALEVNTAGTGWAASFLNGNALPKALRTQGALQFTGIGEGQNRILMTDVAGNANWNTLASVGGVSGTGTLNFVPKWTPNGTFIGNSQVFDNSVNVGIATTNPLFKLDVNGTSRFVNTGFFNQNLVVADTAFSSRVMVTGNSADYIAIFSNLNPGDGDGIKIKLGRNHPMWDGGGYLSTTENIISSFTPQINTVRNWVLNGAPIQPGDILGLVTSTGALLLGTLCQLTNFLTDQLNTALNLPLNFPGLDFPGWYFCNPTDCPPNGIWLIPPFPILPSFTLIPAIPQINCGGLPSIQAPNMSVFNVNNSLNNENNFILFADKDDREMGAIRAQSITDFRNKTLDIAYFFELVGKFSGVDFSKGLLLGGGELAKLAFKYNKIGVEYASGHGDYAEWMEREDFSENISAGDIVSVKSGKITKNLSKAEQIMVVSHRPIMLGNKPEKEKEFYGNAVAFMGQVPVKVMGPVTGGDYIVAKAEFAGMGVAVKPENMTTEDFRLTVGRSWETNENDGPKMVNTVVGVHNNDFLKIVADMQQKTLTTEQRLKLIEEKLNIPAGEATNPQKTKKGF